MRDLRSFELLSFDCYGTLIDWESGLSAALGEIARRHRIDAAAGRLLELFGRLETRAEQQDYRPYREILREVVRGLGRELGFEPSPDDLDLPARSLAAWQPFPDTVEALRALRSSYRLAVISNIDDDLFSHSAARLGVPLDFVVTAQQVGSYKPSPNNFTQALARFGVPPQRVLHVAQSLYHDIQPAGRLGLATVWVNRRRGQAGSGATPPASARPDLEVPDLKSLARAAGPGARPKSEVL